MRRALRRVLEPVRHALHWVIEPAARVYVGFLFIMLCLVIAGGWAKISSDEASVCAIQARGLPISHELAASMNDIHTLLMTPPSPGSPPVPPKIAAIVTDLNNHLARYQMIEARQPQSRRC